MYILNMNIKKILSNTILKDLYLLLTAPIDNSASKSDNDKEAHVKYEDHLTKYLLDNLIVGRK